MGDGFVCQRQLCRSLCARSRERYAANDHRPRHVCGRGERPCRGCISRGRRMARDAASRRSCSPISRSSRTRAGSTTFVAQVMPANHRMIEVFRESGFEVEVRSTRDAIEIEFPTSMDPRALERFRERDRIAAVAAVGNVLTPRSVAVIGASRRRGTVGGELLHNVVSAGFTGTVYAVNEHGGRIDSLDVYRSVNELPEPVDLAVVAVPGRVGSSTWSARMRRRRSSAVVVISAGLCGTRWRRKAPPGGARRHLP